MVTIPMDMAYEAWFVVIDPSNNSEMALISLHNHLLCQPWFLHLKSVTHNKASLLPQNPICQQHVHGLTTIWRQWSANLYHQMSHCLLPLHSLNDSTNQCTRQQAIHMLIFWNSNSLLLWMQHQIQLTITLHANSKQPYLIMTPISWRRIFLLLPQSHPTSLAPCKPLLQPHTSMNWPKTPLQQNCWQLKIKSFSLKCWFQQQNPDYPNPCFVKQQ